MWRAEEVDSGGIVCRAGYHEDAYLAVGWGYFWMMWCL